MPEPEEDGFIAINYTSGTTGFPKGVMYTHRGAYLNALGEVVEHGLTSASVYLWTLPMFHCNGWCFPWAVTAAGARHVCLRQVDPQKMVELIRAEGVTHMCGAPVVVSTLTQYCAAHGIRPSRCGRSSKSKRESASRRWELPRWPRQTCGARKI